VSCGGGKLSGENDWISSPSSMKAGGVRAKGCAKVRMGGGPTAGWAKNRCCQRDRRKALASRTSWGLEEKGLDPSFKNYVKGKTKGKTSWVQDSQKHERDSFGKSRIAEELKRKRVKSTSKIFYATESSSTIEGKKPLAGGRKQDSTLQKMGRKKAHTTFPVSGNWTKDELVSWIKRRKAHEGRKERSGEGETTKTKNEQAFIFDGVPTRHWRKFSDHSTRGKGRKKRRR